MRTVVSLKTLSEIRAEMATVQNSEFLRLQLRELLFAGLAFMPPKVRSAFWRIQLLFLIVATALHAADIRLLPDGSASKMLQKAQAGDVFILSPGTWTDTHLKLHVFASEAQPVILRAETNGKTIFTGRSSIQISGSWVTLQGVVFENPTDVDEVISLRTSTSKLAQHCRVTECEVRQTTKLNERQESKWLSVYGRFNRVDHCALTGKMNGGTTLVVWVADQPGQHEIDHNYFGPRPELGRNGGETIRIGTSEVSMNEEATFVHDNRFEACDGETEIISNKSSGNRYERNTFIKCAGSLTLRHGNRCVVTRNIFLGEQKSRTGGIRIIGEDHLVTNNYLEGLTGDDSRSAISFMNGVPNSPLNEYFQV